MSYQNMTVGTNATNGVCAIMHNSTLLYVSFFDRARNICRSVASSIENGYSVQFDGRYGITANTDKQEYTRLMSVVPMAGDRFSLVTMINKAVGKEYLLTDEEHLDDDFYNFLMKNFKLPLLREWTPFLRKKLFFERFVSTCGEMFAPYWARDERAYIDLHGRQVPVSEVKTYAISGLTNEALASIVKELVQDGSIRVCDVPSQPLHFENMDEYITKYGPSLVKNLEETIQPLTPLNGELAGFAAKHKRLFPQQAACVNGMIALRKADSQYGIMCEGMGCGKTLQGAAVVDSYFNQEWLAAHPGKTLKDLYLSKDRPKYRNVLMAPSHLVEKWKEEILSEIPMSKVTIIKSLDQLLELRSEGMERKGREWYLLSKDFAKLGSQKSPIPSQVAHQHARGLVCKDCAREGDTVWIMARGQKCEKCGGREYEKRELKGYGKLYGLVCPHCGDLLLQNGKKYFDSSEPENVTLKPKDFNGHKNSNDICPLCGTHLWGVDAKPVISKGLKDLAPPKKWYKVSHWKNCQRKNRVTSFVLKGHENEYYTANGVDINGVEKSPIQYGPRRFAPSLFIKKYLKGWFDFCVLDEAHKYEHGGTAQAVAAHALMKVSDFTLCLTGTISNGRADSFFYLLYMLDPRRMRKMGYDYSDVMQFSKDYGSVETSYEADLDYTDGVRNSQSRGRQLTQPKVKPGISPKLFIDFLLDKAVFLDLSDLSKFMPPLKEQVVTVKLPDEVQSAYSQAIEILKGASKQGLGRGILSTMLQFGLAYPDKPYGFKPVLNPFVEDELVLKPASFDEYAEGMLLPKEEKLVEIVKGEINEDRNCFIYCSYTGAAEMNITQRLKEVVEKRCNLAGQVLVMESASPKAADREAYIKKKAAEGIRVFICNMRLVETGLDFCFKVNGKAYNYPSIIFYQMTYELAVMWQASRRHYRLNQTEECRTYYMCYENTLQAAAVQIMAEKQVAASAIQGKFSAEGLAAMASGVDPRIKLAQMLSENDNSDRESLESMFDVMNRSEGDSDDSRYEGYNPPKTFSELMEGAVVTEDVEEKKAPTTGLIFNMPAVVKTVAAKKVETVPQEKPAASKPVAKPAMSFQGMFFTGARTNVVATTTTIKAEPVKEKKPAAKATKKKSAFNGQMSLFGFAA